MSTVFGKITYTHDQMNSYLLHLGEVLNEGWQRAGWLAVECFYLFGLPEKITLAFLDDFFKKGLLQTNTGRNARPKV
jgi:hypothetical protein